MVGTTPARRVKAKAWCIRIIPDGSGPNCSGVGRVVRSAALRGLYYGFRIEDRARGSVCDES
jgi:hypothetical protein